MTANEALRVAIARLRAGGGGTEYALAPSEAGGRARAAGISTEGESSLCFLPPPG